MEDILNWLKDNKNLIKKEEDNINSWYDSSIHDKNDVVSHITSFKEMLISNLKNTFHDIDEEEIRKIVNSSIKSEVKINLKLDMDNQKQDTLNENQITRIVELFGPKYKVYYMNQSDKSFHSFGVYKDPSNMTPEQLADQFSLINGEIAGFFKCSKIGSVEDRGVTILQMRPEDSTSGYSNYIIFQGAKSTWTAKKSAYESGYAKFSFI